MRFTGMIMILSIRKQESVLEINWHNGITTTLPFIWLRDIDPIGFHPETLERVFDLTTIDIVSLVPDDIEFDQSGLFLLWPETQQRSFFCNQLLLQYGNQGQLEDPADVPYHCWFSHFEPNVYAAKRLANESGLNAMLMSLKRDGIVIVNDLEGAFAGEAIGNFIGFKRETNFGIMFEVENKQQPNNLAYTAIELPLHTDLSNQELPPGYQFLHCIKNDAQGGESVLADGFAIAEALKAEDSAKFNLLCQHKMPFRFQDESCDIRFEHPLITEEKGVINNFIFNAHIAQSIPYAQGNCLQYYQAYQHLMHRIRDPQYALQLKLKAGEMFVFDNRRILHGRKAFNPATGARHLRGFYIDKGEVNSKIRMLAKALEN
jgi:gamma-butyrobetaine dioxygenase